MQTSGLTNAPISKLLLIYTIASSIALSIFDLKHVPGIHVSPHLFPYGQYWRILIWQIAGFTNSTEALFAAMLAYHLRVVERAWGKRKIATFLLSTLPYTTLLPPILLTIILRPLSLTKLNYLPSGPTATLFALLAQYYASIPSTFRYCVSTSSSSSSSSTPSTTTTTPQSPSTPTGAAAAATESTIQQDPGNRKTPLTLSLSDKSTTYLVAAQLALSQFPAMVLPAVVGWMVGLAWRAEMLPGLGGVWRVPGWVVGEKEGEGRRAWGGGAGAGESGSGGGRFEDMRRRLESEAAAAASGSAGSGAAGGASGSGRQRAVRG